MTALGRSVSGRVTTGSMRIGATANARPDDPFQRLPQISLVAQRSATRANSTHTPAWAWPARNMFWIWSTTRSGFPPTRCGRPARRVRNRIQVGFGGIGVCMTTEAAPSSGNARRGTWGVRRRHRGSSRSTRRRADAPLTRAAPLRPLPAHRTPHRLGKRYRGDRRVSRISCRPRAVAGTSAQINACPDGCWG
jgi:hypothetical protein